jgi:hypothetical protein
VRIEDNKMIRKLTILLLCSLFFTACKQSTETWPTQIRATVNLVIPEKSEKLKYYQLNGTYQAIYKTTVCWPAEQFIVSLADGMTRHGWRRLAEDSLNPGLKHSWARQGSIFEQWGNYLEKDFEVYQWMEEWEDNNQNLVRYALKYMTKRKGNTVITSQDCNLGVVVIYIPKELRPTPAEIESMHKNAKTR